MLERGEKLDNLVERSNALSAQSKMFYKTAKKVSSVWENTSDVCSKIRVASSCDVGDRYGDCPFFFNRRLCDRGNGEDTPLYERTGRSMSSNEIYTRMSGRLSAIGLP